MKKRGYLFAFLIVIGGLTYSRFGDRVYSVDTVESQLSRDYLRKITSLNYANKPKYAENEVVVKFKENDLNLRNTIGKMRLTAFRESNGLNTKETLYDNNMAVMKSDKESTQDLINKLKNQPEVEYVEPNYYYYPLADSNDTLYNTLWGLKNTGQAVNGSTGVSNADMDGPEAWDIEKTISGQQEVVVAVIDTGVAYDRGDLAANMWNGTNCKNESGATISGGCPNHGWDYGVGDNDPYDISGHGTHVAGIVAAVSNNSKGVSGVSGNNKVKIMALKIEDASGHLTFPAIVNAINFAKHNGAKVINASFGGPGMPQAMADAINGYPGLFVAAAGNESANNDTTASFPANHTSPNVLSVAATNNRDLKAVFSNYGATKVHVGAPGESINSSWPGTFLDGFDDVTPPAIDSSKYLVEPISAAWKTVEMESGPKVLMTPIPGVNSTFTLKNAINVPAGKQSSIGFMYVCLVNSSNYLDLEVSNGGDWTRVMRVNVGDGGGAEMAAVDISQYAGANFKFRFKWTAGATSGYGCFIEDVSISTANYSGSIYAYKDGTSMAAPYVAGEAGLILSINNNLTTAQVKDMIMQTGVAMSDLSGKTVTGKRVNLKNAVQAAKDSLGSGTQPTATPTQGQSQPTATPTQGQVQPTATPVPGSCTKTCTDKNKGNAHINGQCNSLIDLEDFNVWKGEFMTYRVSLQTKNDWNADFNCDGKVNMADYGVWLRGYIPKEN